MTENQLLPASGLIIRVHPPHLGEPHVSRFPKGGRVLLVVSLAPLIIAGLVVSLLLKEPLLFLVAIAMIIAIVGLASRSQKSISRQHYSSSSEDWMSKTGFYMGPFDDSGLPGAASFERQHGRAGNPPQVRLVISDDGLSFGPAGHSGSAEVVPFTWMQSIDLIEGTHPRKVLITPPVAAQRGQVVVTTLEGKTARFSGIASQGIRAALAAKGALVEDVRD